MPLVESRPGRPVLIRITPLIDVVFILLIFFMLTSRLAPLGAVEISSASGGGQSTGERLPNLHLQAPDGMLWNGEVTTHDQVLDQLERLRPETVIVSTDPQIQLTRFTQWQGLLAERGIKGQWRKNGSNGPASAETSTTNSGTRP